MIVEVMKTLPESTGGAVAADRPTRSKARNLSRRWLWPATCAIVGAALIAAATALYGQIRFGSPIAPLAIARGERILLTPAVYRLGECGRREKKEIDAEVINLSDAHVRVVGGTADCTCVSINALPIAVPCRGSAIVPVMVRLGADDGRFEQTFSLYIDPGDGSGLQTLQGVVKAEIRGKR